MNITVYERYNSFKRLGVIGSTAGYMLSHKHSSTGDFFLWVEDEAENRDLIEIDRVLVFKEADKTQNFDNMLRNTGVKLQVGNGNTAHPYTICERAPTVLHSKSVSLGARLASDMNIGAGTIVITLGFASEGKSYTRSIELTNEIREEYLVIDMPKRDLIFNGLTIVGTNVSQPIEIDHLRLSQHKTGIKWEPAREDSSLYIYSGETAVIVKSILSRDDEGFKGIEVHGYMLSHILSERIIWKMYSNYDTAPEIIKDLVTRNVINTWVSKRNLLGVSFILPPTTTNAKQQYQQTGGYIIDAIYEVVKDGSYGINAIYDWYQKRIWLYLYKQNDRSRQQSILPRVVLTRENNMLFSPTYKEDATAYKTTALVAGAGEAEERVYTTVNDSASGWERKEVYFDARDLQPRDMNNEDIPADKYEAILQQRGIERLEDYPYTQVFDTQINTQGALQFNVDFFLGDSVTVVDTHTGITGHLPIERVEVSEDSEGPVISLVIGKERVTFERLVRTSLSRG